MLGFGIFPAGECQHDAGRIGVARRQIEKRNSGGKPRTGDLHFDGVWESLRRAVGAGDCGGYVGMAKKYSRANGFACGYGGQCITPTCWRFVPQREEYRRRNRTGSPFASPAGKSARKKSLSLP